MGLDIADSNNDGWADVYTTDMLPEDDLRLKLTSAFESWEVYQRRVANNFHHQFMRNMLQLNNGDGTFSDIGQLANVARTDWSWGALIADFDLDGYKDIFVTNGILRDVTSQDTIGDENVFVAIEVEVRYQRAPTPIRSRHVRQLPDVAERAVAVVQLEHVAHELVVEVVRHSSLVNLP